MCFLVFSKKFVFVWKMHRKRLFGRWEFGPMFSGGRGIIKI